MVDLQFAFLRVPLRHGNVASEVAPEAAGDATPENGKEEGSTTASSGGAERSGRGIGSRSIGSIGRSIGSFKPQRLIKVIDGRGRNGTRGVAGALDSASPRIEVDPRKLAGSKAPATLNSFNRTLEFLAMRSVFGDLPLLLMSFYLLR